MKRSLCMLAAVSALSACALPPPGDEHAAHRAQAAAAPGHGMAMSAEQMDKMMARMQPLHDKMVAATTLAERQALMAEHMQAMRGAMGGMGRMGGMGETGSTGAMSPEMRSRCQAMMAHDKGAPATAP